MLFNGPLPGKELVDGQLVAIARFFQAEQATAHSGHHFSLAADHPTLGVGRRKVGDGERTPIGTDDKTATHCPEGILGHVTLYILT